MERFIWDKDGCNCDGWACSFSERTDLTQKLTDLKPGETYQRKCNFNSKEFRTCEIEIENSMYCNKLGLWVVEKRII